MKTQSAFYFFGVLFCILNSSGCDQSVVVPPAKTLAIQMAGTNNISTVVPDGTTVRYAIRVPDKLQENSSVPLVLLLHYGYEGAVPKPSIGLEMIQAFERGGLGSVEAIVVAPVCAGGDWKSNQNVKSAVWLTQSVMKTYNIDTNNVIISGFSMGGEGAWYIGSRYQDLFTAVLPVAAPPSGGNIEWNIPIVAVHSSNDEVVPYGDVQRNISRLKENGADAELISMSGPGHYDVAAQASIAGNALQKLILNKKKKSDP